MDANTLLQKLFFTTILIKSTRNDGSLILGTGFIVNFELKKSFYPFLITNKHVIEEACSGELRFHVRENNRLKAGEGSPLEFDDFDRYWKGHPDPNVDVAAMAFSHVLDSAAKSGLELFYQAIPQEMFPSDAQVDRLEPIEEVMFVGYPSGIYDTKNYLPIVRRGTTASPLQVNYENAPIFLIDASVFPGSSGSPVFILGKGQSIKVTGEQVETTQGYLLGLIASTYSTQGILTSKKKNNNVGDPTSLGQFLDLGVVFKSKTIVETARLFFPELA